MKRKDYQAPKTSKTLVELESPICAGSIDATAKSPGVTTTAQDVNRDFGTANDFSSGSWDGTGETTNE